MKSKQLIENNLMQMVVEEINDEGEVYYRLNSVYEKETIAGAIVGAAKLIDKLRKFQPDDELRETNRKLGADLLKSQAQLVALQKDKHALQIKVDDLNDELIKNSGKQTRLDILNKRLLEMESERNTYKYCYEFLAVQHKKES